MYGRRLKILLRDAIPERWQVPLKYWVDRLRGTIEPEMALLPMLVRKGERAIDVGANRGTYAIRLGQLGTRVEMFECNPVCLRVIKQWATGQENLTVHATALSSAQGEAQLHVPVDAKGVAHDASGSIENTVLGAAELVAVPMKTLDSFGFTDAALIKIDVEGHEGAVIEGAAQTIAASKPALIVEIEQRHLPRPITDVFRDIVAMGYDGWYLDAAKLVPVNSFDLARDQAPGALGLPGARYINNFLFLCPVKFAEGHYPGLASLFDAN